MVGKYVSKWSNIEKGWKWAEVHNMFQEILAAKEDNGYVFRVHRVLADSTQTTIIYTVEAPTQTAVKLYYKGDLPALILAAEKV